MKTILAEYQWARKPHRIEYDPGYNGWTVKAQSDSGTWNAAGGVVPVRIVAKLLGAPEKLDV